MSSRFDLILALANSMKAKPRAGHPPKAGDLNLTIHPRLILKNLSSPNLIQTYNNSQWAYHK